MKETTRFVVDLLKRNRKELRMIILVATLGSILTVIAPYVYGRLFDLAVIPNSSSNLLLSLIGIWVVLSLMGNYISNSTSYLGEILGTKMGQETEAEAYARFLTLPILFHKKEQRGEVLQKIARGSNRIQGMTETVADILPQWLMLLFSLGIMFFIKWELALVLAISFLIYGLVTLRLVKPELAARKREHITYEKQYGKVYDKLYNVFLVKNFAMEDEEKTRFSKSLVGKILPVVKNAAAKSKRLSVIQGMIYSLSFVAVLGGAVFFLRAGQITPGEFIMFFGYINLAFSPLRFFGSLYRQYKRTTVAIRRFLALEKIQPERMKHGEETIKSLKGNVEFENTSFGYNKNQFVLKNINLKIKGGETIALVGKSGVGKTTLAELIMGYYQPSKGKIKLDGVEIQKLRLEWLRNHIAVVPQDLNLFNDTMINNIKYANPQATRAQIVSAAKAASAHEFIKNLPKGYDTKVGEEGIKLSMGQRQRIAITMAFLKNPRILILDEPTAALDAESERKVQEGIDRLVKGKTTFVIAHRFSTVRNADKIVVLDKGKIAELGNHQELMKAKGIYYNLYSLQKGLD